MRIEDLETPVAVVDLDILERNIQKFQAYLDEHGVANRPHIKTHKIPEIAHMQMAAGAVGITCQKLGEAEVMVQAGIRDIFIPYNLLGKSKLDRLMRLQRRATISVTSDSEVTVTGLSQAAKAEETTLPVLVEFDSGLGRCGVQSPSEASDLAEIIANSTGLDFGGLMSYPNNEYTDSFVRETRKLLNSAGLEISRVSGGGTRCMWDVHHHPEITEHRAGMYVYGDRSVVESGAMDFEDCSLRIMTTVVSRPTRDWAILDAGSKTLSSDLLGLEGHGIVMEYPRGRITRLSEEHGRVDLPDGSGQPEIGERVTVIPNHCCVVNNLFNQVAGIRKGQVEVFWPVAARGALT